MLNYKNLPIFAGVTEDIIQKIVTNSPRETFVKGTSIIREGDPSNGKGYIIESGEVIVWIHGDAKATLKEGDMFGEIALLNEETRVATVNAKTDVTTIVLSYDNLLEMLNNDENNINKEILRRLEENLKDAPIVEKGLMEDDNPNQIKQGHMI